MISVVKIFLNGDDNHIESIEIPKDVHYQIINKTKGSIGQAHNYPNLVKEIQETNQKTCTKKTKDEDDS